MRFLLITVLCFFISGTAAAAEDKMMLEGFSSEEALHLGERMYRDGILPSGEPMQAIVMGDIPVDGRMFTCDDCHQRSGLGSVEGTVITWPTNGRELYKPRRKTGAWHKPESDRAKQDVRKTLPSYWQIEDVRPAYTDKTLARVLRAGVDPAGGKDGRVGRRPEDSVDRHRRKTMDNLSRFRGKRRERDDRIRYDSAVRHAPVQDDKRLFRTRTPGDDR